MKICWENLEPLRFSARKRKWFKGGTEYVYVENCNGCGEDFLSVKRGEYISSCCSRSCLHNISSWKENIGAGSKRAWANEDKRKNLMDGRRRLNESEEYRGKQAEATKRRWADPATREELKRKILESTTSVEARHKMSKIVRERYASGDVVINRRTGSDHHGWKGGVTKLGSAVYETYALKIDVIEDVRTDPKNNILLQVRCTYCGKWFNPTRNQVHKRIMCADGRQNGESRLYCSNECKGSCSIFKKIKYEAGRRPMTTREVQPQLRKMVFERDKWRCVKCGSDSPLHCHHITGVEHNPVESADIDNCVTLCKKCHRDVHKRPGCSTQDMRCK